MTAPPPPRNLGPRAVETPAQKNTRLAAALGVTEDYLGRRPHEISNPIQPGSFTPPRDVVTEYSFEWWFNYFWSEGRRGGGTKASPEEARRFWSVATRMFTSGSMPANAGESSDINVHGRGMKLKVPAQTLDDATKQSVLHDLLTLGFEEFPVAFRETAESLFAHQVTMPALHAGAQITFSIALGYRSDSRTWAAIQAQGIKARSHVPVLLQTMNMSQPWHPFSDVNTANKIWFRRGAEDNCLHSVISIASKLDDALYFPRIDDGSIYKFRSQMPTVGDLFARWTPNVNQSAGTTRASLCKVTLGTGEECYLIGSRTSILVFAFPPNFMAANTESYQRHLGAGSPFPERGVGEVDSNYVLAILDVYRVHHGPTADDGQTNFIKGITETKADDTQLKAVLLTDDAVAAFHAYIAGLRAKIDQPHFYPKDRAGISVTRLLNDDAYGAPFRNNLGGIVQY